MPRKNSAYGALSATDFDVKGTVATSNPGVIAAERRADSRRQIALGVRPPRRTRTTAVVFLGAEKVSGAQASISLAAGTTSAPIRPCFMSDVPKSASAEGSDNTCCPSRLWKCDSVNGRASWCVCFGVGFSNNQASKQAKQEKEETNPQNKPKGRSRGQ